MSGFKTKCGGATAGTNDETHERGNRAVSGGRSVGTSTSTGERVYEGCCGGTKTGTSSSRRSSESTFRPGMEDDE